MNALTIQDFDKAEQARKAIYLKLFPWDINFKKRNVTETAFKTSLYMFAKKTLTK
jgi:hypothetical protein